MFYVYLFFIFSFLFSPLLTYPTHFLSLPIPPPYPHVTTCSPHFSSILFYFSSSYPFFLFSFPIFAPPLSPYFFFRFFFHFPRWVGNPISFPLHFSRFSLFPWPFLFPLLPNTLQFPQLQAPTRLLPSPLHFLS